MNMRAHRVADFLLLSLGIAFILWASASIVWLAINIINSGFKPGLFAHAINALVAFSAGYYLINRRFMGALIGGLCVLWYLAYHVIYPFVYFGFVPSGYQVVNVVTLLQGLLLTLFIWLCFVTRKNAGWLSRLVPFRKVLKGGVIATASLGLGSFVFLFWGFIGGNPVKGRLLDSETMRPVVNAEIVIKYGPGSFKENKEEKYYINGRAKTKIDGMFFIENKKKLITRLQAGGFHRLIDIKANGYEKIALISTGDIDEGEMIRLNMKLKKISAN